MTSTRRVAVVLTMAVGCLGLASLEGGAVLQRDQPKGAPGGGAEDQGKGVSKAELVKTGRRCATPDPSAAQRVRARGAIAAARPKVAAALQAVNLPIVVPIRFHVIHRGDEGKVTAAQIDQQIDVLNKAYKPHQFQFSKQDVEYVDVNGTNHEDWFTMGLNTGPERRAKKALGKDQEHCLNFYTANPGNGILGWATFPADFDGDPEKDGVVILHSSLPGGSSAPYNLGNTATHEIGHWLGLYHTFQSGDPLGGNGCVPPGDEVEDTPSHRGPNMECTPADSCEKDGDGKAPIHNYMNYTPDECMTEFTPGQRRRMFEQVGTFRSPLIQ